MGWRQEDGEGLPSDGTIPSYELLYHITRIAGVN